MPKMILNMVSELGMFTLDNYLNCKCKELKLNNLHSLIPFVYFVPRKGKF